MESSARATAVFHRFPRTPLRRAVAGEGIYVIDDAGRRYIDASGGAAVSCLGHSHRAVTEAIKTQVDQLAFAHTSFFTNEPMEELADLLVDTAPAGLGHVYFMSGGSEGIEAALKLARQYYWELGQPRREVVISRRQSYHGNTLGALAAGGNIMRRAPFEAILRPARHVSACYEYRGRRPDQTEEEYGQALVAELAGVIEAEGPERIMCFIAETVAGATIGAVPPVPGYFAGIRKLCDRHGILLILDEVMCGMGRTGTLHACEQEAIAPDILVVAKGLGAGYQPIGAMLASNTIFDTLVSRSGHFQHGHTYSGHVTACAAALAVQKAIRDEDLLANVRSRGAEFESALVERFGNHPRIGDIRGRGLFYALEFVTDRATREPFDPRARVAARLKEVALQNGLMCYPMGGGVDGTRGDHVMLAPPFILRSEQIDEIIDKLDLSIGTVLAEVDGERTQRM